jgi:hypothetical protein
MMWRIPYCRYLWQAQKGQMEVNLCLQQVEARGWCLGRMGLGVGVESLNATAPQLMAIG